MTRDNIFVSGSGHVDQVWPQFGLFIWFSPILFAIHVFEDAPQLAEWMRETQLFEPVSRGQLIVALLILVMLFFLCTGIVNWNQRWGIYAFLWMQSFVLLHGVAHLIPSIWLLRYTPGSITGILLILFSILVYRRTRTNRQIRPRVLGLLFASAVLLYDPVVRLAFKAAGAVTHQCPDDKPDSIVRIRSRQGPIGIASRSYRPPFSEFGPDGLDRHVQWHPRINSFAGN